MTPEQITALAREYAEKTHHGNTVAVDNAIEVINFLSRRFALVEKGLMEKAYLEAKTVTKEGYKAKSGGMIAVGEASKELLKSLFPEIAKEVKQ